MKKGFIISIDAIIALLIAFAMLVSISANFSVSKHSSLADEKLSAVSKDVLTVLEKSGKLENAVVENKNKELGKYLNKTSENLCFEISVFDFDDNSSALSAVAKKDCKKNQTEVSVLSTKRSFFVADNEKFYWAELKSWIKVAK